MRSKKLCVFMCVGLVLLVSGVAAGKDAPGVTTARVDCNKGGSINEALKVNAKELIIEIRGMCKENVTISRDWVTLRGRDPELDGIESQMQDLYSDGLRPAVVAWKASPVVLENLTLRGGLSVIGNQYFGPIDLPHDYNYGEFYHVTNCVLEGGAVNVSVREGYLTLRDVTVRKSSIYGIYCLRGRVACWNCNVEIGEDADGAVLVTEFSRGDFTDSTITASGGTTAFEMFSSSRVWLVGSQITADGGIALAVDINSQLGVLASEFSGPLYIARDSLIQLQGGSTQVANPYGNDVRVGVGSTLYTLGNASAPNTLIGPLYIYDFGKAVLSGTTVNGKLKCSSGGDAVDDGAVTVTGSISGCEHFPAP